MTLKSLGGYNHFSLKNLIAIKEFSKLYSRKLKNQQKN